MKIKTLPAFFGQPVVVGEGQVIKFDHTGTAEVNDKLGKVLLEKYPTFMFPEGQTQEKPKTVQQEINQELVTRLEGEIYSLKEAVNEQKEGKKAVEADLKEWQDQIAGLIEEKTKAEKAYRDQKESHDGQVQALELKITLMETNTVGLQKLCEDSGYEKSDWEKLSKEKLIEYILQK
jgi:hypothetical protein